MRFQLIRTHQGHRDMICALAAVPGQLQILSAACDGTVNDWDLRRETHDLIQAASEPHITTLAVFPAGYFFVSGDSQGHLKIWNLETGEIVRVLEGHTDRITVLTITPDGRRLISASDDRTLRIWDALTGESKHVCSGHQTGIAALALTPDAHHVLASEMGSPESPAQIKIWQVDTGALIKTVVPPDDASQGLIMMRDGQHVISHSAAGSIALWAYDTGEVTRLIHPHFGPVVTMLMPDESSLLIGAQIPSLSLWSLDTGKNMYLFDDPPSAVTALAITPDGRCVVAGCQDGSLVVYVRVM